MLSATYTVGAGAYAWTFTKKFDAENLAKYNVQGLAASAARNLSVSHQQSKNLTNRHLIDMSAVNLVPGTTSGQTYTDRVYTVIQRSPYTSDADIKGLIATHIAQLSVAGFQTSVLASES